MSARSSSDRTKKIAVVLLFTIMVAIGFYQFVIVGSDSPRRSGGTQRVEPRRPDPRIIRSPEQAEATAGQGLPTAGQQPDVSPLELHLIARSSGSPSVGSRQNIFAYWVPPPEPPPEPPPPPPIRLMSLQPPNAIAGTPKSLNLSISAMGLPEDPVIFLGGRTVGTERRGESLLMTELSPGDYASARSISVEVKSRSNPAQFYSNTLQLHIQPAPEPPFKYIGRIGDLGLFELTGTKELVRLTAGGTIQQVWRIDSIGDAAVEVTDTRYEIKRRMPMQEKFQ